ncbi:hypothetical protein [Reichenbachiella ulvae]|uniref:hypothetical protein n=1 Tax=Reichenbachiella ulvae TaxID=2980104 RepID=UPI002990678A|nr:hypothetical protein [Reichenbachiella ulvae]
MGVGTILKAKRIVIMAYGMKKAEIVKKTVEGEMSTDVPATFLQTHGDVTFVMDENAAKDLTRFETPWIVGDCEWTKDLKRKAVVWLSQKLNKPILKLADRDYNDNGMSEILGEGGAYEVNIKMFNHFQHTITGWPGANEMRMTPIVLKELIQIRKELSFLVHIQTMTGSLWEVLFCAW